jgi:putative phage-type endonuclease
MRLTQAHPGPTAILIDEFNAGSFQGAANGQVVGRGHCRLLVGEFGTSDSSDAQGCFSREIFGTPAYERARRPHLGAGKRFYTLIHFIMHYAIFHSIMDVPHHKGSNHQTSFSTLEEDMKSQLWKCYENRRSFIGGSDARIVMGSDEAALLRLWREKRGEAEPEDLSSNLVVQLGAATEELNRSWYERNTGRGITDVQRHVKHSAIPWMAATLDGVVEGTEAVFEAKFMLPWSFSEEAAGEKYMAQVQHNMWVTHLRTSVLSIITGGGKWVEITIPMDPLYLSVLVSAEKKFWRCVQSGETPHLINAEPPRPRIEAIRIVDMSSSNSWAEFAGIFRSTRNAFLDHERAKSELKALMPEDAREAIGHGVKAKRSKSGAVSFDVLETEALHAPVQ